MKGILRRVAHRAGIASALESALCHLPGLGDGAGISANHEAPMAPPSASKPGTTSSWRSPVVGQSLTSPSPTQILQILSHSADTDGATASFRDQHKKAAYARVEPSGYGFIPLTVESFGRLDQPAMKLLHQFCDKAAGDGGASRASFVSGPLEGLTQFAPALFWSGLGVTFGCIVGGHAGQS
jgi:hypothetical protein